MKGGYSSEDLAAALGITVEALNTAYTTASDAALTQAVEAGLITQVQADQILANRSGMGFGRFHGLEGFGGGRGHKGGRGFDRHGGWGGVAPGAPATPATPTPSGGLQWAADPPPPD